MNANDPQVGHYLQRSLVMRLATVSAQGAPSLTPIWFVTADRSLVSTTAATTLAARNIAADPRVTILLNAERDGQSDYALSLRGIAEVHHGLPPARVMARFAAKYYLSRGGLLSELGHAKLWRLRWRYYAQSDPVWLAIEPKSAELTRVPRI
jgi:predicted pyridoxine 5'-phosphate oxidase superfamily flavin-nucleotide-binding protein